MQACAPFRLAKAATESALTRAALTPAYSAGSTARPTLARPFSPPAPRVVLNAAPTWAPSGAPFVAPFAARYEVLHCAAPARYDRPGRRRHAAHTGCCRSSSAATAIRRRPEHVPDQRPGCDPPVYAARRPCRDARGCSRFLRNRSVCDAPSSAECSAANARRHRSSAHGRTAGPSQDDPRSRAHDDGIRKKPAPGDPEPCCHHRGLSSARVCHRSAAVPMGCAANRKPREPVRAPPAVCPVGQGSRAWTPAIYPGSSSTASDTRSSPMSHRGIGDRDNRRSGRRRSRSSGTERSSPAARTGWTAPSRGSSRCTCRDQTTNSPSSC
jgi:hypothetical protein